MAREGNTGRKTSDRRKAGSTYRASDQSDEDYTVDDDEEFDESEDGYSSFVGDDSEESLGEYQDEEEEIKTRKVKRVARSRAPSRKEKGTVKSRKRKRVSYREDDDDDDEVDEDDEEFTPDCLDEEEEFPVMKGTNNSSKRRLCEGTVKDEDDEEFTPDCLDEEEEESPVTEGTDNSSKRQLRKATFKDEDEEFTPDFLDNEDEEEESPVMEGTDNSNKRRLRRGTVKDEEDEELNPDSLHEEEDFPVMKGMKNSSRLQRRKATAKDDDEDDEEFTPISLDEEEDIPITKRMKNSSKPRLCKGYTKDDDDDEEFTPDGLDEEEEEEEEFPEMEGIKYSAKPRSRKGTARVQKRNRNHKKLKKITRKKSLKRQRLRRKARSENDEGFIDVDPTMKEKNKKNAGQKRKRKRLTVDSDSDFVASSGSSEREFTISEEEREQVREANNICRSLVTTWRGSASLKKSPIEEAPRLQRKHPARKAKEKMEELKIEVGKQICGICLSEEGKRTVRGTLNCCSHYFCFACIMEWSKVESRCPLCKQRFVTISKPARSDTGFDLRTVVIHVPERDQVYQPSEEELRGYLDPYENVLCTECQQGGDDALMLLCDLCDSPAHTYCVGLGHEVPEGNWYCESCRPTALASLNQQNLNPMPDNRTSGSFSVGSPPVANVRETFDLNEMYVPDTPLTEESGDFQFPRDGQVSSLASGIGAFTVSDRRRIQRQIHQLLNNRRRQLGNITGTLGAVSGNSLFGSQIARSRELATQPAIAQRAVPHNSFFRGRQLESDAHLSQNPNLVLERSSNLSGQLNLNGASTSSQSFFGEFLESELQGTDASFNFNLAHQQLHPCSSRSNVGPDASTSPCQFREPAVPSRTLPSTLRRPF
uniref:Putative nucleolin-like n=2 Tax=Solanum chacoense TaxID=4108 RepID=A0A0V0IYK3_SOLCH